MQNVLSATAIVMQSQYVIAGIMAFCFWCYWLFNKKAKQRHLAELRARYEELSPTDPDYNSVRSLYMDMMLRSLHGDSSHSSYPSSGGVSSGHGHGSSHFGNGHGGDGGGDGGDGD